MPWVIVQLKNQEFGVPTSNVRELVSRPEVGPVPGTPPHMRGVMNLRGRIIPVVDLRQRLGMTSATDETERFCVVDQRRQDHVKWLAELESSVREDREFKLATDPHR